MKISEGLSWRAFHNTRPGVNGCWVSLLSMDSHKYRLRDGSKRVSQLLVLWWCIYGKSPAGQLSNACGDTTCVNPTHYKDQEDRNQQEWKVWDIADVDDKLLEWGIDGEDGYCYAVHSTSNISADEGLAAAGMTRNFHCYHCNEIFDPLKSRNQIVCDSCWTDEDQRHSEEMDE